VTRFGTVITSQCWRQIVSGSASLSPSHPHLHAHAPVAAAARGPAHDGGVWLGGFVLGQCVLRDNDGIGKEEEEG